jgi:[ribosomal protein S5]-alanine N-acetyltransferase
MQSELKSKRLILIQSDVSHASDLFSFWTDPEVSKFMNMESLSTQDEVIDMIEFTNQLAALNQSIRYTVFLKESNQIIGSCGFNYIDFGNERAEIGYDLGKEYWGKGFAFEAASALMNYWFHELGLNRLEARVVPENLRSIRLLNNLGFHFEGILRQSEKSNGGFIDVMVYSRLKTDR